jgi:hypothetical protein
MINKPEENPMKMIAWRVIALLLIVAFSGCQQPVKKTTTAPAFTVYEDIVWVSLSVDQPYLDVDQDQTYDGAIVRVMLNRADEKSFVPGKGTFILRLIKRVKDEKGAFVDREMHKWTIPQEKFEQSVTRQRYGLICHMITVYWYGVNPRGPGWYLQGDLIRTDGKHVVTRMLSLTIPENKK